MDTLTSRSATLKKDFRKDIEGMRAIAVAGVVAFHFGLSILHGGFVGVDVFFVISGYLITSHLRSTLDSSGSIDLLAFYAGRARRLLPSAVLVILATLIGGYFLYSPAEQIQYSAHAFYTSIYAINFKLLRAAFDYFSPESNINPYLHYWSLAVEEQFYLIWPVALIISWKLRKVIPLQFLLAAVLVASLVAGIAATRISQPWAFYILPFRAWEFAAGGLIPFLPSIKLNARRTIGYLGILFIVGSYFLISEEMGFPGWVAMVPVLGAVMVIYSGEVAAGRLRFLQFKPFQWLGYLSYPLYLWHWPIIVYANSFVTPPTLLQRFLLAALAIVLALITKEIVENPIRKHKWLASRSALSLALMLALSGVGVASAYVATRVATANFTGDQKQIAAEAAENSVAVSSNLNCLPSLMEERAITCELGDLSSTKVAVLFGDSHADVWSTGLDVAAKQAGYKLVTVMKSSCSPAVVKTFSFRLRREFYECERWRQAALAKIEQLKPEKIIISELTYGYVDNFVDREIKGRVPVRTFATDLSSTLAELTKSGAKVYLLKDAPSMGINIPTCLSRAIWRQQPASACEVSEAEVFDASVDQAELAAVSDVAGAHYVDMTSAFCTAGVCHSRLDDKLIFRDAHHVATGYSEYLAGKLQSEIFRE